MSPENLTQHLPRRLALWWVAALLCGTLFGASLSAANAIVQVRNPLDTASTITWPWEHPDWGTPPYNERSLDLIHGSIASAPVISRVGNWSSPVNLYYDSFNYGTSCSGVRHIMYENPSGTSTYNYVGTIVYLHMIGHNTSWYSKVIPPSSEEYRGIGWVHPGKDCSSSGPHLHHGRVVDSGSLAHAHWLVPSSPAPQLASNEITLYK